MARPASPHDKLFHEAFGSPRAMRGLLESVLPAALLARLDLSTLTPEPGTFIDEALAGSQSDLLFSVRILGEEAFIYLLVEHKSEVDRWVPLQLLRYLLCIWERLLAQKKKPSVLPLIIPVVIYHGDRKWTPALDFWSLFAPMVREDPLLGRLTPGFEYLVDDLSQASDEELLSRAMGLFGSLAARFLRDARTPERVVPMLSQAAAMLGELYESPGGGRAVGILLKYLSSVAQVNKDEVASVVEKHLPEGKKLMMTIAEQLRQEGRAQGVEEGRLEGRLEERTRMLRRLLELRFGPLDDAAQQRLSSLDEATLETCTERVLTAQTLEDVLVG